MRLTAHKRNLIAANREWQHPLKEDGTFDEQNWQDLLDDIRLSWRDQKKIERRAQIISERHEAASGLSHLKTDDSNKLELLRHGVRLARVESEHHADEFAAHYMPTFLGWGQLRKQSGTRCVVLSGPAIPGFACRPSFSTARQVSVRARGRARSAT
ncbi:hypothetical protein [Yoonia sp. MH D7]